MNEDIYLIPYVEHKYRLFKAHRRERVLKVLLIGSNALWLVVLLFLLMR